VPTHPTDWVWDTLQVTGPMARTAEDVALMLQSIAGASEHAPLSQPVAGRDFVSAARAGARRGLRIAYCADPAGIGVDTDIERVCREAISSLRDVDATVEEIDLELTAARAAFLALRGLWFVTQMTPHMPHASRFGVNVGNNVRAGLEVSTRDLADAERERGRIWYRFRELFSRFDHLVTPCMAVPPFPVEQNFPQTIAGRAMQNYVDWIAPTFVLSLTALPVASVPAGLDRSGLPVGLQVVGPPQGEEGVLALANTLQRLRPLAPPARFQV
jgi:amidase